MAEVLTLDMPDTDLALKVGHGALYDFVDFGSYAVNIRAVFDTLSAMAELTEE